MLNMMNSEHILFVDDEPEFAEPQIEMLERVGYVVTPAENPEEALELLKTSKFDLILLDILIPSELGEVDHEDLLETGMELYHSIRTQPNLRNTPIIFLTVVRDMEAITRIAEDEVKYGNDAVIIAKPALPLEVVDKVQHILSGSQSKTSGHSQNQSQ